MGSRNKAQGVRGQFLLSPFLHGTGSSRRQQKTCIFKISTQTGDLSVVPFQGSSTRPCSRAPSRAGSQQGQDRHQLVRLASARSPSVVRSPDGSSSRLQSHSDSLLYTSFAGKASLLHFSSDRSF